MNEGVIVRVTNRVQIGSSWIIFYYYRVITVLAGPPLV